jgi:hypothetical protein
MSFVLRALTAVVVGLTLVIAAPGPASAGHRTAEHLTRSVGPLVFDAPAGTICDFDYRQEASYTQNLERFYDSEGNLVRVEDKVAITVRHTNLDTGYALTETDRYAAFVDFVSGEATTTGQNWHLVDQDGRLVLTGAGRFTIDLLTGDLVGDSTPHMGTDFPNVICPALGGAAA